MSNRNPILVIVTANNCDHCKIFKKDILNDLKAALLRENKVTIEELNLNSTNDPIPEHYSQDLGRYVKWFPTFVLFNRESWNNGNNLIGCVFNGIMDKGEAELVGKRKLNKNNIVRWVNDEYPSYI